MITLRPHQVANAHLLLSALKRYGGALDGSDTGTGKTHTFLGLCKMIGARPAIVTKKAIIPQWELACREAEVDPICIVNFEHLRTKGNKYVRRTEVRGRTVYEWTLNDERAILCFDEAQCLRGRGSIISQIAIAGAKRYKTVMLSATPFQTPLEAVTLGAILRLYSNGQYFPWLLKHGVKKNFMGHMQFVGDIEGYEEEDTLENQAKGRMHIAKLREEIFPDRGCRTSRAEIPGFPETLVVCEVVDTEAADEITRQYQIEIEESRKRDHEKACADVDPEFHDLVEALPITVNLRARQEVELLKCRAIAEVAKLEVTKGHKVAIFVNFDASIEALSDYLECDCIVRGSDKNRDETVQRFRNNEEDYIIINLAAGGVGLNLHDDKTQVPRVALISPPYSAVMLKQVLGRVHRLNGGVSTQKILFAAGTVEERVMARVKNRTANIDTLLDTDLQPI